MVPTALLQTVGARTGRVRRNAVIYFHDRDRVTIIPSKAGAPENPAWYYNVCANPDVTFGGRRFRAVVVHDEDLDRPAGDLPLHLHNVVGSLSRVTQ